MTQDELLTKLENLRTAYPELPVLFFVDTEELTPEYKYTLQAPKSVEIDDVLWTGDCYLIGRAAIDAKIKEDWETLAEDGDAVSLDAYDARVWDNEVQIAIVVKMGAA